MGDRDDLITSTNIHGAQENVQGGRAIADADAVRRTAKGGKFGFEGADVFAQEELHPIQNPSYTSQDFLFEGRILFF